MIKFFRKIRQQLLSENKFSKYLLYAIGEIILVVIGILIALQINNNNQKKQNKQKVNQLLRKIQSDISQNITTINNEARFVYFQDSIIYLVLNKKLTESDYRNDNGNLYQLILKHNGISIKTSGYDNLMRVSEIIPEAYGSTVERLNILHNDFYNNIQQSHELVNNRLRKNFDILHQNFSWFGVKNFKEISDEQINFLLNSNEYQSLVSLYHSALVHNYTKANIRYAMGAIDIYKEIDQILGKTENYQTKLSIQIDSSKIGHYKKTFGDTLQYAIKNEKEYIIDRDGTVRLYRIAPDKYFYLLQGLFFRLETKKDSTHLYLQLIDNGAKPFAVKID